MRFFRNNRHFERGSTIACAAHRVKFLSHLHRRFKTLDESGPVLLINRISDYY